MTKVVVITGSTRGIGLALAEQLLQRGCNVVISSRTTSRVDDVVSQLQTQYGKERVYGLACDVSQREQVQALWDGAIGAFGRIDIWLNNAALNAPTLPLWEQSPEDLQTIVDTNIIGSINGCVVALEGMREQGDGHIYNVRGYGYDGQIRYGFIPYGMSKYALAYVQKALSQEMKELPVKLSSISPGIVVTDLLRKNLSENTSESSMRILNILADTTETVAPWLADQILANDRNGAFINWLTTAKLLRRFITAPIHKRNVFSQV
jgi:NAD(P)-dependent dehydrogenase (short-subunit alcohol dehydrogenase family)